MMSLYAFQGRETSCLLGDWKRMKNVLSIILLLLL